MERNSLDEVAGKRCDSQSEQDAAEEVNKDVVAMKCDTEHGAQKILEVSSNNKDCFEEQKNDGKGAGEVRRENIEQDTALARRYSIDCHAKLEKPNTSGYSGKRRRKRSYSSILGESDELGEMNSYEQRPKIHKMFDLDRLIQEIKKVTLTLGVGDEDQDTVAGQKQPKFWKDIRDSKLEALNILLDEYDLNKEKLNEEILPVRDIFDHNLFKVTYCDFEERFHFLIAKTRIDFKNIINEYLEIQPEADAEFLGPIVHKHNEKLKHLVNGLIELHHDCENVLQTHKINLNEINNEDIPLPVFVLECMTSFCNTAKDIVLAFSYRVEDIEDYLS